MYDFWYTLGTAIIHPNLLDAVRNAHPAFDFCPRLTVLTPKDQRPLVRQGPSTGLLKKDPTNRVRVEIFKFLRGISKNSPPVGVYTAGRFCQLILIPSFDGTTVPSALSDLIRLAHSAYEESTKSMQPKNLAGVTALLGLLMVDGVVAGEIQTWPSGKPGQPLMEEIVREFGIEIDSKPGDFAIVTKFVQSNDFKVAAHLFMDGTNNPWFDGGTTLEQAAFSDASPYAIP